MINLSLNGIGGEDSKKKLDTFLPQTHENFTLVLTYNDFDGKIKEKTQKETWKKIAL